MFQHLYIQHNRDRSYSCWIGGRGTADSDLDCSTHLNHWVSVLQTDFFLSTRSNVFAISLCLQSCFFQYIF